MKLLDLFLIFWPCPFALYFIGVSVKSAADSVIMADWFDCIDGYDFDKQYWCPTGHALFDWNHTWRDPEIQKYLKGLDQYQDYNESQITNLIKPFQWFCDDADSFMQQVANKEWHGSSQSYRDSTIKSIHRHWKKAVSVFWPGMKETMSIVVKPASSSITDPTKWQRQLKKVTFGPALFWSEDDFEEIERGWDLAKRKKLREKKSPPTKHVHYADDNHNHSNSKNHNNKSSKNANRSSNKSSNLHSNLPGLDFFSSPSKNSSQSPQNPPKSSSSSKEEKGNEDTQSIHSSDSQVSSCLGSRIA